MGTAFAQLESIVLGLGRELQKRLLDLLLARQAEAMHRNLPEDLRHCPPVLSEASILASRERK